MATKSYEGPERRKFVRLDYITPLAFKVCKQETMSRILQGYTADVSQAGLQCTIKQKVQKDDILWLSFDRATLAICEEMEKNTLIYQNGVIGKVVRVESKNEGSYVVGVFFITRQEKNITNIYPKIKFLKDHPEVGEDEESE